MNTSEMIQELDNMVFGETQFLCGKQQQAIVMALAVLSSINHIELLDPIFAEYENKGGHHGPPLSMKAKILKCLDLIPPPNCLGGLR